MKKIPTILLIAALVLFAGCCKKTSPPTAGTVHTIDSIVLNTHYQVRDSLIVVPPVSVQAAIPVSHIGEGMETVRKSKSQAKLTLSVKNGKLQADCACDTVAILAKLKDTYTTASQSKHTTHTIVQKVRYIPWWVKILAWTGGGYLMAMAFILSRKLYK